jgi:hypothetical protein
VQRQCEAPCSVSSKALYSDSAEHRAEPVKEHAAAKDEPLQRECPRSDKRCVMALSPTPGTLPETAAASGDRLSDLIQKLVAAATAEVENAAQRTRAQAQIEITELQRTIARLRDDVQTERDRLEAASTELILARAAASQLKEELEGERVEKARFAATLETVRLVISGIDPEVHGPDLTPRSTSHAAEGDDELTESEFDADLGLAEFQSGDPVVAAHQSLQADDMPDRDAASQADAAGHLAQLLTQIEEIYRSDLKSSEGTSEVVTRLAANLAYARDAYARRLDSADGDDVTPFDRQVAALRDARSGTPFGRHLAMALRVSATDRRSNDLQEEAC